MTFRRNRRFVENVLKKHKCLIMKHLCSSFIVYYSSLLFKRKLFFIFYSKLKNKYYLCRPKNSELSSVGLERCLDKAEVMGSNPLAPTLFIYKRLITRVLSSVLFYLLKCKPKKPNNIFIAKIGFRNCRRALGSNNRSAFLINNLFLAKLPIKKLIKRG
jgi:hypothetical protein